MRILFLIVFLAISTIGQGQRNAVYTEFLGNGGFGSINYERQLSNSPCFMARLGMGYKIALFSGDVSLTIPVSLHYLWDINHNNFIDLSLGASWMQENFGTPKPKGVWWLMPNVGFRRNFFNTWMFRAHITPYVRSISKRRVVIGDEFFYSEQEATFPKFWLGFAIGKRF